MTINRILVVTTNTLTDLIAPPQPMRCDWPGCRHPDICEGTHYRFSYETIDAPRRRWAPTRKRGQR